jgi:hypothetical protein
MNKKYYDNIKKWKKAYTEILNVCKKYPGFNIHGFNDIDTMAKEAKKHLMLIEWYEKYKIKVAHNDCYDGNINLNRFSSIILFMDAEKCKKEHYGRSISYPDDGRQPVDGWYYVIKFPTGAFIFGEDYDYQIELFKKLIKEIKGYSPDHCDTVNNCFYWKIENCKKIFDNFPSIIEKYYKINQSERQEREVKKLEAKLEQAKNSLTN